MSEEIATGAAHDLQQAGYSEMPDAPTEKAAEFQTPREAAASRAVAVVPTVPVVYQTPDGERIDSSEVVTAERAARDLTAYRSAQSDNAAKSISADFAFEVDVARAVHANVESAAAAAKMGIQAAADAGIEAPESVAIAVADAEASGLEPSLEKAMAHPQVREAIEAELSRASQAREQYATGLHNANAFSQAALIEIAPELSALPLDQFQRGLETLAQVNPQRFQSVMNLLDRVGRLQAEQQQEQQRQHLQRQQQFDAYATSQDQKFRQMVPASQQQMREVGAELESYASELGIERGQLIHLFQTEPLLRHSAFQRVIYDAVQARIRAKARPVPTRTVPTVQRPGVSAPRNYASENLSALSNQLTRSGSLKDAAALLLARRGGKR
jgi:hypothetical protein